MGQERESNKVIQDDAAIILSIKEGKDDHVLSTLYKNIYPKIKNLVLKNSGTVEEAEDIFQDAVIVFYRYVQTGRFKEEYDIDGFIYGVSKNLFSKYINKKRRREDFDFAGNIPESAEGDLLENIITKEKENILHNLVGQLGDRCMELLTHTVFYKLSMKEVCEKMGFANENVAKTANYKCKQRLMKMVKDNPSLIEIFRN